MAVKSFSEIANRPDFQAETPETKALIAEDFFNKNVATQAGFSAEKPDIQSAIKQDFLGKYGVAVSPKAPQQSMTPSGNSAVLPKAPEKNLLDQGLGFVGDLANQAGQGLQAQFNHHVDRVTQNPLGLVAEPLAVARDLIPFGNDIAKLLPEQNNWVNQNAEYRNAVIGGGSKAVYNLGRGIATLPSDLGIGPNLNQVIPTFDKLVGQAPANTSFPDGKTMLNQMEENPALTFAGEQVPYLAMPLGNAARGTPFARALLQNAAVNAAQGFVADPNVEEDRLAARGQNAGLAGLTTGVLDTGVRVAGKGLSKLGQVIEGKNTPVGLSQFENKASVAKAFDEDGNLIYVNQTPEAQPQNPDLQSVGSNPATGGVPALPPEGRGVPNRSIYGEPRFEDSQVGLVGKLTGKKPQPEIVPERYSVQGKIDASGQYVDPINEGFNRYGDNAVGQATGKFKSGNVAGQKRIENLRALKEQFEAQKTQLGQKLIEDQATFGPRDGSVIESQRTLKAIDTQIKKVDSALEKEVVRSRAATNNPEKIIERGMAAKQYGPNAYANFKRRVNTAFDRKTAGEIIDAVERSNVEQKAQIRTEEKTQLQQAKDLERQQRLEQKTLQDQAKSAQKQSQAERKAPPVLSEDEILVKVKMLDDAKVAKPETYKQMVAKIRKAARYETGNLTPDRVSAIKSGYTEILDQHFAQTSTAKKPAAKATPFDGPVFANKAERASVKSILDDMVETSSYEAPAYDFLESNGFRISKAANEKRAGKWFDVNLPYGGKYRFKEGDSINKVWADLKRTKRPQVVKNFITQIQKNGGLKNLKEAQSDILERRGSFDDGAMSDETAKALNDLGESQWQKYEASQEDYANFMEARHTELRDLKAQIKNAKSPDELLEIADKADKISNANEIAKEDWADFYAKFGTKSTELEAAPKQGRLDSTDASQRSGDVPTQAGRSEPSAKNSGYELVREHPELKARQAEVDVINDAIENGKVITGKYEAERAGDLQGSSILVSEDIPLTWAKVGEVKSKSLEQRGSYDIYIGEGFVDKVAEVRKTGKAKDTYTVIETKTGKTLIENTTNENALTIARDYARPLAKDKYGKPALKVINNEGQVVLRYLNAGLNDSKFYGIKPSELAPKYTFDTDGVYARGYTDPVTGKKFKAGDTGKLRVFDENGLEVEQTGGYGVKTSESLQGLKEVGLKKVIDDIEQGKKYSVSDAKTLQSQAQKALDKVLEDYNSGKVKSQYVTAQSTDVDYQGKVESYKKTAKEQRQKRHKDITGEPC